MKSHRCPICDGSGDAPHTAGKMRRPCPACYGACVLWEPEKPMVSMLAHKARLPQHCPTCGRDFGGWLEQPWEFNPIRFTDEQWAAAMNAGKATP